MKRLYYLTIFVLVLMLVPAVQSEIRTDGFVQGLFGGFAEKDNPTLSDQSVSETRLQVRMSSYGDNGEFFSRTDFTYDGLYDTYDWEIREAYLKFRLGSKIDFKVGRQIITWGTGDLIFINDVFAKDYRSFFIGRDDQYLKAPQNALRMAYYNSLGSFSFVFTPRFEANRLPTGDRLSYFNPAVGKIVSTNDDPAYYFDPPTPEPTFHNSEFAVRYQRRVGMYAFALYFYKGFYKNPRGVDANMMPIYPGLLLSGFSLRGAQFGGILWIEGGYYNSKDNDNNDNPMLPHSSMSGLIGFEKQIATNLTVNLQYQADKMQDYDKFEANQPQNSHYRDEIKHLITSRWTKMLRDETVTLSGFIFYSPNEEDMYLRYSAEYKYTDEITLAAGGNLFDGTYANTEFGQFALNDNMYVKMTYNF